MQDLRGESPAEPAVPPPQAVPPRQWVTAQFLTMIAAAAIAVLLAQALKRVAGREVADEWAYALYFVALAVGGRLAHRVPRAVAGGVALVLWLLLFALAL